MKILMIGLGGIGQRHVRNLRTLLGSEIEILAYRVRRLSQVVTEQLGIEDGTDVEAKYSIQTYRDLEQALAQHPEAAFICNPSSLHIPAALQAAQAGCHLFIEKPLSHSYEGVEELVTLVERQNLVALVAFQMRFHPCLQRLHTVLQEWTIGQILAVRIEVGEYLPGFHTYEDYRQMYAARRDLGGGVILSQIHELDYVYWLFGLPRLVFAIGGHLSSLEIDVEDVASILMECVVDGRPFPVHVHQDYIQRPPGRTCQVIGDAGKILLDFCIPAIMVYNGQGELLEETRFTDFQRNQLFLDELSHFLECVQGKQTPVVTVRDGACSLRMALAAKKSLETRQVVELQ
jgi:predicted dehydrogenase